MKRTKFRKILFLPLMLVLIVAFALACGTIEAPGGGGKGNRLPSVDASTVVINKQGTSLWVSWNPVAGAQYYQVKSGNATVTTELPIVDLATASGFTMPASGAKITVTIIAKGEGYADSAPTSITYEEGQQVRSPEITSFTNGVIKWKKYSNVTKTVVKADGVTLGETTSNTFDISSVSGNVRIDIILYNANSSATLSLMYNSETGKLSLFPITEYTVSGDILRWNEVGGAIGYKVVDLDFNSYEVSTTHYIMDIRNIVYGVYPVMPANAILSSAEVAPVDIKYLDGSGTSADPYLIKTPFDLRTIDYYELKSSESGTSAQNYYKIANDIDYNTVSALEGDSNMFTLRKPFLGVLDGDNKTLSNISVTNNNGFWSMFEFIAKGGIVKNIKFGSVEISNSVRDNDHPLNSAVAVVAYRNFGTVEAITLNGAKLSAKGGGVAGLVSHNYGTVTGCTVSKCELKQGSTSGLGTAAYEMAGVVLENLAGGNVNGNTVNNLTISGTGSNIGSSAGVVSINRASGTVTGNSFDNVTINNLATGKEAGGVVAYCATGGNVTQGSGTLGSLKVGTANVTTNNGTASSPRGKLYGKKG